LTLGFSFVLGNLGRACPGSSGCRSVSAYLRQGTASGGYRSRDRRHERSVGDRDAESSTPSLATRPLPGSRRDCARGRCPSNCNGCSCMRSGIGPDCPESASSIPTPRTPVASLGPKRRRSPRARARTGVPSGSMGTDCSPRSHGSIETWRRIDGSAVVPSDRTSRDYSSRPRRPRAASRPGQLPGATRALRPTCPITREVLVWDRHQRPDRRFMGRSSAAALAGEIERPHRTAQPAPHPGSRTSLDRIEWALAIRAVYDPFNRAALADFTNRGTP